MLEPVVAGILNRFLSAYVDNLNTSQLTIGIWSGKVKLKNLRLKKEALDKLRLPVDVVEGYLGDLTLNIPWSNLKGEPVGVVVENVYLLAVPTALTATPEEEEDRMQATKQQKLANAELMLTEANSSMVSEAEEKRNESFINSLVTKIVDNLQFEVRNIHLRYEDEFSTPGHPFAIGLTLSRFSAVSTDSNWIPQFITSSGPIHKLAKLEGLSLYFDTDSGSLKGFGVEEAIEKFNALIATSTEHKHSSPPSHQYVLKPVSGEGRLVLHPQIDTKNGIPKTDIELLFEELSFSMDDEQYRDTLGMLDLFHFYTRRREYNRFRPAALALASEASHLNTALTADDGQLTPGSQSGRIKALWMFATTAVRSEIHEKNRKWSWSYFEERRDDRREYVRIWKEKSKENLNIPDAVTLDKLERKLSFKDIRFYRSIAKSELRKERALQVDAPTAETTENKSSGGGWFSWAGWGGQQNTKKEDSEETLNEEDRQKLYQAIEWDESEALSNAVDIPAEAILLRAKTKLQRGSFALRKEAHKKFTSPSGVVVKGRDLILVEFEDFRLDFQQRPENFVATLGLGGLGVTDGTLPGTLHPQIVRVEKNENAWPWKKKFSGKTKDVFTTQLIQNSTELGVLSPMAEEKTPFFWAQFEHKPLDERADNALAVRLRHMEIIYHKSYVEEIFRFLKPPASQLESVGALIDVASETLEGIRKETRAGLEYALETHSTVDVQLDLSAPIIIIPESVLEPNCQHIVLDAGHISVESDLADKGTRKEIKDKERQEYTEDDYKRLESLMYDKFFVKLEDAQLLLGPSLKACMSTLEAGHSASEELHILERTSLTFLAQNCILDQAPNLTRVKISGSLPSIQVNISDKKYKNMMKMIDVAIPHFDRNEEAQVDRKHVSAFAKTRASDEIEIRLHDDTIKTQPDGKDDDDNDEFFDTQDIAPSSKVNIHQKTFEFTFQVDYVQASIFKSFCDVTTPDKLLVNAVLEGFRLEFSMRPHDMSVDILLSSLYLEDKMIDSDTEFRHLVTSKTLSGNGTPTEDLVRIRYHGVQKDSPEFMTVYEGFDKTVDIELSTINVIITRASILTLFDWVMTTFTGGQLEPDKGLETLNDTSDVLPLTEPDKLRVKVKLTSIVFVLNEDGFRLATLSLSAADVSVILLSPTMRVTTTLGNIQFFDDFSADEPREMLSILGQDLADFRYETYDPEKQTSYPGYDTSVYLRSGSLAFTLNEEPVHRILVFFSQFKKMKDLYDAAASAAAERATVMSNKISKMHYDILINTPILLLPQDDKPEPDVVVANLGEIAIKNEFEVAEDQVITKIKASLSSIRLTSTLQHEGKMNKLQILEDVTINVDVTQTQNVDPLKVLDVPATVVSAIMNDVKINLTQVQWCMIMKIVSTVPRAFSLNDDDLEGMEFDGNGTVISVPQEKPKTVIHTQHIGGVANTVTDASFAVGTIRLKIFSLGAYDQDSLKDTSLARFTLSNTRLKYKGMSDASSEAEIAISSFTVHDTRTFKQTKFREIIPAITHDSDQFMINYTSNGTSSFANLTIDSPKIIFSLDPVMALLEFVMSPFKMDNSLPKERIEDDRSSVFSGKGDQENESKPSMAFRINVVSPSIILLDSPEQANSEAIVLSISQVQMTQQRTLALSVSQIGWFLCKMDKPQDNIRIVDNFDITVAMDSNQTENKQMTYLEVRVLPLVLRVSFNDLLLINSIINRAIEMTSKNVEPAPEEKREVPVPTIALQTRASKGPETTVSRTGKRRRSSLGAIQPQLIIIKESLRATFDGVQLVLIGTHDLPILDIKMKEFTIAVSDWSSDLNVGVTLHTFISYFNLRVSHWEPLIDPWEFSLHVRRVFSSGELSVKLSSKKRLELNVTSTFIELVLSTMSLMNQEQSAGFSKPRGGSAPFMIKNRTGYTLFVKSEAATDSSSVAKVADGDDKAWRFEDWKALRENIHMANHNALSLKFDGIGWDPLRNVVVDREGEHIYSLRPKLDSVAHRLFCEVKLVDNVKIITFRSTFLIENRTLINIEAVVIDENGKRVSQTYKILAGEDSSIPILSAFHHRLKLRPDPGFGYGWCSENLYWRDLIKKPTRSILCKSAKDATFRFQAYTIHDRSDPLVRVYPKLSLRLRAPVEVQNLLPHDIRYRVFDKNIEHNWSSFLRQGGTSPIHVVELSHLLLLSAEVQDSVYQRSEFSIINTDNPEDLPVEKDLAVKDNQGVPLHLRLHYQKHPQSGGAFRVQLYTPYLLINKTGLSFGLRTKGFLSAAKMVAGLVDNEKMFSKEQNRFMFSFPNVDARNKVQLRIGDSQWSDALSFETVGMETEVVMASASGGEEIHIGLKVAEGLGDYKLTKVITIYPRFIVKNDLDAPIRFREHGSKDDTLLVPEETHRVGFIRKGVDPMLVLSLPGPPTAWSAPVKIRDIGRNFVRVMNGQGETLISTDVILEGPTVFIRLGQEKGNWPIVIRNSSDTPVTFWQASENSGSATSGKNYIVAAHSSLDYAWDFPAMSTKNINFVVNGVERLVNVMEIGSQVPLRFKDGATKTTQFMSINVRAEGSTQAIIFSNYEEEQSVFKLKRVDTSLSVQSSVSSKDVRFQEVNVDNKVNFGLSLNFEGIGISIVNKAMKELVYVTFRGLSAKYADSTTNVAYDLSIKWIQIDNQLYGALYPILLYPSVIPTNGKELDVHPSLQVSIIMLKEENFGVTYYKYASILLQEMTIELDEDFLLALIEFSQFSYSTAKEITSEMTDEAPGIAEPRVGTGIGELYFEVLHLQPIQLDLSFMRTDRMNAESKAQSTNALNFFINALTMALGNVNDAPVRLNSILIENARLSMPMLQERLMIHYRNEFFGQLYRVVGSADFLGNPVGLFTNVSSGVADFFIQPYDSIMMNGDNSNLGIGIARGAGSLAKKTVFGISDSFAKFTGSLGKGLSAATLDTRYQNQRRMRLSRNKPKHALYGVTAGATSLVTSVASGFEGLATKPLEGAEAGGATGFLKGVGKGLVGVVTKPAVGLLDFANNVTEGIRNTTTVFDQTSIDRVRLPRFTASDGVLRPYSEREALGQSWLKNAEDGKYFGETYVAHLDLASDTSSGNETLTVIVTMKRILLLRVPKLKVGWDVPLVDLKTITLESNGLLLVLRGGVSGPFLSIPDKTSRMWLFRHMERVVTSHNSRRDTDS